MKHQIEITVDTNDADYVTEVNEITEVELLEISPLIQAIKNSKDCYNYGKGDVAQKNIFKQYPQFSNELHDLFLRFCPTGECGFHSIKSIYVSPLQSKLRLL